AGGVRTPRGSLATPRMTWGRRPTRPTCSEPLEGRAPAALPPGPRRATARTTPARPGSARFESAPGAWRSGPQLPLALFNDLDQRPPARAVEHVVKLLLGR